MTHIDVGEVGRQMANRSLAAAEKRRERTEVRAFRHKEKAVVLPPGQRHPSILFYAEEIARNDAFRAKHAERHNNFKGIEEQETAPLSLFEYTWRANSLGWWWTIRCNYCNDTDDLTEDMPV